MAGASRVLPGYLKGLFSHTLMETETAQHPRVTNTELERCQLPTVIRTGKGAVSVSLLKSATTHQRPISTSTRRCFVVKPARLCRSRTNAANLTTLGLLEPPRTSTQSAAVPGCRSSQPLGPSTALSATDGFAKLANDYRTSMAFQQGLHLSSYS